MFKRLNDLSESHGALQPGKGMVAGVIALILAALCFLGVMAFHFLRHFPAWVGWLPAHTPRLARVSPPVQPEIETQDRVESPTRDNPL